MIFIQKGKTNWKYLIIIFVLAILVSGVVLLWRYVLNEASSSNLSSIAKETKELEVIKTREEILKDLEDDEDTIGNFLFSSDKNKVAFIRQKKSGPFSYKFQQDVERTEPRAQLISFYNIVIFDLTTQEEQEFDVFDLVAEELISYIENIPNYMQYYLRANLIQWSVDDLILWGNIDLFSSADPPMRSGFSTFQLNIEKGTVTKFSIIPEQGGIIITGEVSPDNKKMLYEIIFDGGLSLNIFDFNERESKLVVSYSEDIFDNYCASVLDYYYHPSALVNGCDKERNLSSEWINTDTISYFDFETREKIIRGIADEPLVGDFIGDYTSATQVQELPDDLSDFLLSTLKEDGFMVSKGIFCHEISDYSYGIQAIDFNEDGVDEFAIFPSNVFFEEGTCEEADLIGGYVRLCGRNCPIEIYQKIDNNWVDITSLFRNLNGTYVGANYNKKNGYRGLLIFTSSSNYMAITVAEWDKDQQSYDEVVTVLRDRQ